MITITKKQLVSFPMLENEMDCPKCGKPNKIQFGKEAVSPKKMVPTKKLSFIECCDSLTLVGINGRNITSIYTEKKGEINEKINPSQI